MVFREEIRNSPEYKAATQQAQRQSGEAETVGAAVSPVMQLEKTDVQFWCNVATVVLLFLIWRELSRGGY